MEAVATAAAAAAAAMVDLNTLSRRELQALCKLNGVRANMTNVAMVEALQSLPSVDGIDQVGTTLCLPTPGKSAMKSALRTAAASDQQQQGSPLPRGRRVSVKSPEAIRTDAEEGEEQDEAKRELFREIVRTPGVALRSTSRRARATPAPLPTPAAAGTLRRSQRSTVRKATAVQEVEVSTTRRSTRKAAIPKVTIDFDQEEEAAAPALEEDKVQQVAPKGVTSDENPGATSDEKCHDPEEEEATELPKEGNSKADEPDQGEEGAAIVGEQKLVNAEESAPLSAIDCSPILRVLSKATPEPAMKNVEDASTEYRDSASEDKEVVAVELPEKEQKLVNAEKSAPLSAMEGSPILGVLSKATPDPVMKNVEDTSTEDREVFDNSSPVQEIADEINNDSEDKEVVAVEVPEEAVKEDAFKSTVEAAAAPNNMVPAAVTEKEVAVDESAEKYDLVGESSEVDDLDKEEEKHDRTVDEESDETIESAAAPNNMVPAAVTDKEVSADDLPQADLTDDESAEEYDLDGESSEEADLSEESSEVDELDEEEEDMLNVDQSVDEESDETIEVSGSIDVNFDSDEEEEQLQMPETGEETDEVEESGSLTEEEDDFSGDLSSEFDDLDNFSEEDVASQHVETIVKSLDEVTITEEKKEECAKKKKQLKVGTEMSLRKLKSAYKESLIAAKEGKKLTIATDEGRMALAELDNNAE